jgi:hypothetical protein
MGPVVTQVWVQLSHEKGAVTMVTSLNCSWSHTDRCKFFSHHSSLNVRHFEATILKYGFEVTFSGKTYLLNVMKSTSWFRSFCGGHRPTDRLTA